MNPPRSVFGASPLSQKGTLPVLGCRQRPGKAGSAAAAWRRLIHAAPMPLGGTLLLKASATMAVTAPRT